jgi:His/Glu/Gln/Arg/opine family amino acid ABC transporter permease subunit
MPFLAAADFQFDWFVVTSHWREFLNGALIDIQIASLGFVLACAIGLVIALLRLSRNPISVVPSYAFVQFVRGIPLYVMVLWLYFGIAIVFSINLTTFQAAVVALALTGSGYTAEIFRAGIIAVDRGQFEAGQSLGMNPLLLYRQVILPQAFRIVIPPLGNIFIGLLKGATIVSVIAVKDMVYIAQEINVTYYTPFEAFTAVAVLLVAMVLVFSSVVWVLERRLKLP